MCICIASELSKGFFLDPVGEPAKKGQTTKGALENFAFVSLLAIC
jgi:hypothetical protein